MQAFFGLVRGSTMKFGMASAPRRPAPIKTINIKSNGGGSFIKEENRLHEFVSN